MKKALLNKKIGIILTDTIYGIVGLALDEDVVERIYKVKKRDIKKPMIILISSIEDLSNIFGINLNQKCINILKEFWPGNVSVILPCKKFKHIHRGLNSIAFRLPNKKELIDLIKETGPLVSTSANKEGEKPTQNIIEAKKCFHDEIDFYVDGGEPSKNPSILIKLKNEDELEILRGKICLKK